MAVITGTNAAETLSGGTPDDQITGLDGNDQLNGNNGNDVLNGGAGADTLNGGGGTDTADYSTSGAGVSVTINATTGNTGGDAAGDSLTGIENLTGSGLNDTLTGDGGANSIVGGDGADLIAGLGGVDTLDGGNGNDTLIGGAGGDRIVGGGGNNTADYTGSAAVTVNLLAGTASGGHAGGDTLVGIQNLTGGAGNDVLTGDTGANILSGAGGTDQLNGGDGNDTLIGGASADTLTGGAGTDTADYTTSGAVTVNLSDTATETGNDAAGDSLVGIENVTGSGTGADSLTGNNQANLLSGLGGNDTLRGNEGADTLDGGTGDDRLFGGLDHDLLIGGDGADSLQGDTGNDTLSGGAGADTLQGGLGADTADYSTSSAGVTVNLTLAGGQVSAGDASGDTLSGIDNLVGSSLNDALTGDGAGNILSGGDGDDTLSGGLGNDSLVGGSGADVLTGGPTSLGAPVSEQDLLLDWTSFGGDGTALADNFSTTIGSAVTVEVNYVRGAGDGMTVATDMDYAAGGSQPFYDTGEGFDLNSGIELLRDNGGTAISELSLSFSSAAAGQVSNEVADVEFLINDIDLDPSGNIYTDRLRIFAYDEFGNLVPVTITTYATSGQPTVTVLGDGSTQLLGVTESAAGSSALGTVMVSITGPVSQIVIQYDNANNTGTQFVDMSDVRFTTIPVAADGDTDTISGGAGNDTLTGGVGNDSLDGGADNDSLDGQAGDDTLTGGDGTDVLVGGEGADSLDGGADNDTLSGDNGNDTLLGQGGADVLSGGGGADLIAGGSENDSLSGGTGNDTLQGDAGADTLDGGDDADQLSGGAGADLLNGGTGSDLLQGDAGNDTLQASGSGDTLQGGDDSDSFILQSAGSTTIIGGEGGTDSDTLDLGTHSGYSISYTSTDPNSLAGTVTYYDLNDHNVTLGTVTFSELEGIICFTPGTLIETDMGLCPVELLREGDLVQSRDNGLQAIGWVGRRDLPATALAADETLRPVVIKAGSLGENLPARDLVVSPAHRMLIQSERASLYFEENEVLVAAKYLAGAPGIRQTRRAGPVSYIHFMCENHEVVRANGSWTESFLPGDQALAMVESEQRAELFKIFPELAGTERSVSAARRVLRRYEARALFS